MSKCATRVAYGKALAQLVQENPNIVVLDADLAGSTKSGEAAKVCPERHFDMGIAEANMMCVAAGLAASGKIAFALQLCHVRIRKSIRADPQLHRLSASERQDRRVPRRD